MLKNWIEVKFSDIAINLKRGPFGGNLKKEFFVSTGYKVYEQKHAINKDYTLGSYFINEQKYQELQGFVVEANDYIISCSGTIGKLYRLPPNAPNGVINQALLKITIQDKLINHSYFSLLFESEYFQRKILSDARGSGMQNLAGMKEIKLVTLPLAPLPEQRAIAAKIEQLFSELDNGIANLKTAKSKLEIYRQAVFKKMLDGIKLVDFEEIIKTSQNGISKRQGINGKETKVLRLADISNLKINYESPRYILLDDAEIEKYKINKNDLLVIRVNGSKDLVGRLISFTQKDELETWGFCDHFIRLSLDSDKFNSKFYFYFFQMPETRKYIHDNMVSSAGQNTVSQVTIKSVKAPYLDKTSQDQIVQEIETRLSVCDKLNESIDQSLEKAQALRQSILKKAFEGKLLSQDELQTCCQQPDWEPAAKLLERVKNKKNK